MSNKLLISLGLVLFAGLIISAIAAERMVVCEEAYSEG